MTTAPALYAIHFESGDHMGLPSSSGLLIVLCLPDTMLRGPRVSPHFSPPSNASHRLSGERTAPGPPNLTAQSESPDKIRGAPPLVEPTRTSALQQWSASFSLNTRV